MTLEPEQVSAAVDDFVSAHPSKGEPTSPLDHAARPAHLTTVEAFRALGRHIAAMGDLVLRDFWDDAGLAVGDRDV